MAKASKKATAALVEADGEETKLHIEELQPEKQNSLIKKPATLNIEQRTAQELARFDVPRQWIAQKKAEYAGLIINGMEDKEGYKKVHAAWQEIKNKRISVDKKHKELKNPYLVIGKALDGEKNDLTSLLTEIENPLSKELDRIDNLEKEEKARVEREAAEKLEGRVKELCENGMLFNGSYYAIGENISMDIVTLKDMNDDIYSSLLEKVQAENKAIIEAREAKEKAEQAERDRVQQEKEANEKKEKELQEKADKLAADAKKFKDARRRMRAKELENGGMIYNFSSFVFQFGTPECGRVDSIHHEKLENLEDEDWEPLAAQTISKIVDLKAAQAAKDKERADAEAKQKAEDDQNAKEKSEKEALAAKEKAEKEQRYHLRTAILNHKHHFNEKDLHYIRSFKFDEVGKISIEKIDLLNWSNEEWEQCLSEMPELMGGFLQIEERMQKELTDEQEKQRQENLSDAQKIREFMQKFDKSTETLPELTSTSELHLAFASFIENITVASAEMTLELQKHI